MIAQAAAGEEEVITFDEDKPTVTPSAEDDTVGAATGPGKEAAPTKEAQTVAEPVAATAREGSPATESATTDFEQIGSENVDDDFGDDGFDVELDELEAEIARELEE